MYILKCVYEPGCTKPVLGGGGGGSDQIGLKPVCSATEAS